MLKLSADETASAAMENFTLLSFVCEVCVLARPLARVRVMSEHSRAEASRAGGELLY